MSFVLTGLGDTLESRLWVEELAKAHTSVMVALIPSEASTEVVGRIADVDPDELHCTIAYLGKKKVFRSAETLKSSVKALAQEFAPVVASVTGVANLGPDRVPVLLIEHESIERMNEAIMADPSVLDAVKNLEERHPHFTPHVTIGNTGPVDESKLDFGVIVFDRIGVFIGGRRHVYRLQGLTTEYPESAPVEEDGGIEKTLAESSGYKVITKMNPHHDRLGRFTTAPGGGVGAHEMRSTPRGFGQSQGIKMPTQAVLKPEGVTDAKQTGVFHQIGRPTLDITLHDSETYTPSPAGDRIWEALPSLGHLSFGKNVTEEHKRQIAEGVEAWAANYPEAAASLRVIRVHDTRIPSAPQASGLAAFGNAFHKDGDVNGGYMVELTTHFATKGVTDPPRNPNKYADDTVWSMSQRNGQYGPANDLMTTTLHELAHVQHIFSFVAAGGAKAGKEVSVWEFAAADRKASDSFNAYANNNDLGHFSKYGRTNGHERYAEGMSFAWMYPNDKRSKLIDAFTDELEPMAAEFYKSDRQYKNVIARFEGVLLCTGNPHDESEEVIKFNPYHDRHGRFATAPGGAIGVHAEQAPVKTAADKRKEFDNLSRGEKDVYESAPSSYNHDQALAHVATHFKRQVPGFHSATDAERKALVIPPAWRHVIVHNNWKGGGNEKGLVASGIAANGKLQYKYSADRTKEQSEKKFARNQELDKHLDRLDSHIDKGVRAGNDDAIVLGIIRHTGMRPGGGSSKSEYDSYGATTLQARHVKVRGDKVTFNYVPGKKKGQKIQMTLEDPKLARAITKKLNGKSGTDELFDVSPNSVREFMRGGLPKVKGTKDEQWQIKDLRTTVANHIAMHATLTRGVPKNLTEYKKWRNEVGDQVSGILGNTRTMALNSYINPQVFATWAAAVGA